MSAITTIEPTNIDGRVGREGASEAWATITTAVGNSNDSGNANIVMRLQSTASAGLWQAVRRGLLSFDPTDNLLPTDAIVTAVTLSMLVNSTASSFAQSLCVTKGTLASPTAIAAADYQGTRSGGQTEYANRILTSAMAPATRSIWTFNATGRAAVQTAFDAAATSFIIALYFSGDLDAVSPTWISGTTDDISLAAQDTAGSASDPQLAVTYRIGPGHAVVTLTGTLANSADTVNASFFNIEVFT